MSLKPAPIQPVPEETARVARAAFRKGNPSSGCATSSAPSSPTPTSPTCSPGSASRACRRGAWRWSPAAVPREPARPAGRGGGAGADRLEVPARAGADRPRLRPLGPVRVPLAPAGGQRRGAPLAQAARGLPGPRPAQGARPAAHRRHPRAGLDPRAQPPRAGRRDAARGAERARDRRPGLAA